MSTTRTKNRVLSREEAQSILADTRTPYMRQFESAQIIWDALKEAGPKGLTKKELLANTGLTVGQFNYALAFIKDVLMEKYEQPLVCNATTYRYSLPPEVIEAKDYIDFRVRGILSMVRRVEHAANASALKWGDQAMRDVQLKVRHLRETLENLANV